MDCEAYLWEQGLATLYQFRGKLGHIILKAHHQFDIHS